MKKRIFASLLSVVMLFALLPTAAFAEEETPGEPRDGETGVITIAEQLTDAISNASNGATIQLGANITSSITIEVGKNITLDLNGHTLTNTAGQHTIINKGTLTIVDNSTASSGTVDNVSHAKGAVCNYPNATVTLEGGTYTRSQENGTQGGNSWYTLKNYGTMTIKDGVTVNQGPDGDSVFSSLVANGYQNESDRNAVGWNNNSSAPTMTISGGTFVGGLNTIKNDDYGVLTISGGTFENVAQHAVMNWNDATISNGTFESTGSSVVWNGYDSSNNYNQGKLTISGGEFTAPSNYYTILSNSQNSDGASVTITGGTYHGGALTNVTDPYNAGEGAIIQKDGSFQVGETAGRPTDSKGNVYADDQAAAANNVAKIGITYYPSLQAAVDAVTDGTSTTIILLKDASGNGVKVPSGKNITFDFGNHKYDINGTTVGSTGTETNGFQLLKNSNITFKGGTLTSSKAIILIQNYSNLTLENMNLDGTNTNTYVLSNNNGDTKIIGSTSITAADGQVAFDICWAPNAYPSGAHVTVNTTGTITGKIELGHWTANQDNMNCNSTLAFKNGTFVGEFAPTSTMETVAGDMVNITGGNFSQPVDKKYLDESLNAELKKPSGEAPYSYYKSVDEALAAAKPGDAVKDLSAGNTEYTVTLNNGFGGTTTLTVKGGEITLPSASRSGYTFLGWKDSTGTVYAANTSVTISGNTTFTAQWRNDKPSTGGSDHYYEPSYTVSTPANVKNGTVKVSPKSANKGDTVTITVTPDEGYELDGIIVTDKKGDELKVKDKGNGKFTFTMPASKVSISVRFVEAEEEVPTPVTSPSEAFIDLDADAWYREAADFVLSNGMMDGNGAGMFLPYTELNRGMMARVLYNMESKPAFYGSNAFSDVASGTWYTDAVNWAAANKIVSGNGGGLFLPDAAITREGLAVILYNYASYKGYNVDPQGNLSVFTDGAETSPWARNAMEWAVGCNLISGKGGSTLDPKGTATRIEVAQLLMNFCEAFSK